MTPRILLLGDYSNCHRTLATGLRRLGCEVTLASNGGKWMDFDREIDISRPAGALGGLRHYLHLQHLLRGPLAGFDVVAIHDVNFAELKPHRQMQLLCLIKERNRHVSLTAMSTDVAYLDMVEAPDTPLRYSEWFVGSEPSRYHKDEGEQWRAWHAEALQSYQHRAYGMLDSAVSVLYEYHLGLERMLPQEKIAYGGLPVDTSLYQPVELPERLDKVRLFLGRDRTRMLMKGSDLLEAAARRVVDLYPDKAELIIVENRPFHEFTELLRSAHVVLDQIYSYTPATTALMAMSYGLNVVSGFEPEYYDFIGEHANRPGINAPTEYEPLVRTIEDVVLHPELLRERGQRSREFVVRHNDCEVVARRFLEAWRI